MTHLILDINSLTLEEKNKIKNWLKMVFENRIKIYHLEVENE